MTCPAAESTSPGLDVVVEVVERVPAGATRAHRAVLLRIRGALNAVTGDRVAEALERLGEDRATVIVDLSAVDRVDLAGLGTLLRTSRRLRQVNATLVLTAPSSAVSHLLLEHGLTSTVTVTHAALGTTLS